MKKVFILFTLWLSFYSLSDTSIYAQQYSRIRSSLDVALGKNTDKLIGTLHYQQYLTFPRFNMLQVGWGIRGVHTNGKNIDFTTAPANLTQKSSTIDTLQMPRAVITNFNFTVGVQFSILNRLDIGVNTDLIGLALGGKRTGTYLASAGYNSIDSLNLHKTAQMATPTFLGLQWFANKQVGNLNNEVYARLYISQRLGIKVGYIFNTTEYLTQKALLDDNRRFRSRTQMIQVGITFRGSN